MDSPVGSGMPFSPHRWMPYGIQRCGLNGIPDPTGESMPAVPRSVPETFAFACGGCGHAWEATFQLMFFTDPLDASGLTTQEYVDEAGRAVRSPLADAVCPRCGSRRVSLERPE